PLAQEPVAISPRLMAREQFGGITEEQLREAGVTISGREDGEEAREVQRDQGHYLRGGSSPSVSPAGSLRQAEDVGITGQDVIDYALFLGLDPEADAELMHLAREGLEASNACGWKAYHDQEGKLFYFNFKTGVSSWDHPADATALNLAREKKREKLMTRPRNRANYTGETLNNLEADVAEKHDENHSKAFSVKDEGWWPGYRRSVFAAVRNAIGNNAEHVVIIQVRSDAALGSAADEFSAMLSEFQTCYLEKKEPFFAGDGSVKKLDWENMSELRLSGKHLENTLMHITSQQTTRAIIVSVSDHAVDAVIEVVRQHNRRGGVTEVDAAWAPKYEVV
ncbi:unnamed protein product, partial [Prorocentrum cordatum]